MISRTDCEAILKKVSDLVQEKHFNPSFAGADWPTIAQSRKSWIPGAETAEDFESETRNLVTQPKTIHTCFFHETISKGD
jgi:hypothetical protein